LTTIGIGGPARHFIRTTTVDEIREALSWAGRDLPVFILGGGSNLLISDAGFPGLVIHVDLRTMVVESEDRYATVKVAAGEPWDSFVEIAARNGWAGIECLSGIPGSTGATPIQNVGAYGQEVAGCIDHVTAYDVAAAAFRKLSAVDCAFSYRMSRFKRSEAGRFVICDVTFRLRPGPPTVTYPDIVGYLAEAGVSSPNVGDARNAVIAVRRRKGMVIDPVDPDTRSVGSFFMNPVVPRADLDRVGAVAGTQPPAYPADAGCVKLSAAWLIERSGFRRGDGHGNAGISTKHTLAIVNRGDATARDVLRLAARIKRGVLDRFDVNLRPEPIFVGFSRHGDLDFLTS
jgi:UDP-N-acetylmuramate dehydrogenase